ncbi:adenylate/guanylate cyclase domain-containing protein [Turneriella parva]|uniref:Adenylate/guanylate cyclase n=1 Tax=Turneriella parva (strain ATCC BAA-1111 / DSM 21527 / NCTC 11395 / H) TaxID=869212 RepID=I4B5S4_TURPD|nr:adenylate/guanylate cyclase domain-containing protein [Turneriella parva]AFM12631.1 adenylate/guanylate cyclase [Turneriella parva DSM 21527]
MQWTQAPILIRIRFFASLVLVFYTATHFMNHALGLVSLEALEEGRKVFLAFWRNTVFQFLFPVALFLHAQSSLWRLMFRQAWHFSRTEKIKIYTGLAIPFILLMHLAGTRAQWWLFGYNDTYSYYLMQNVKDGGIWFVVVMSLIVWVHAWYGATATLDLKPWFARYRTAFLVLWIALPTLGLAGVLAAATEITRRAASADWVQQILANHGGDEKEVLRVKMLVYALLVGAYLLLMAALWAMRRLVNHRAGSKATINVQYADGPAVKTASGTSLLEVSLLNGIEHAHVCGGNGRCSTCRVRVLTGLTNISRAESSEQSLLNRIGAEGDVRLACQARVTGDVKIAPLIGLGESVANAMRRKPEADGIEREVVVFFSDLKGFTSFSESRLPYDVVFVLNQYFRSMGKIIEDAGGYIDKFIGDGIMAIFGLSESIDIAAQHAIEAALKMHGQLALMNEFLAAELRQPLELRIGLHSGPAIIGEIGYGKAAHLTAIGDVVNTASRLEHANKKLGTWLLVSDAVMSHSKREAFADALQLRIRLRGKSDVLAVHGVRIERRTALAET